MLAKPIREVYKKLNGKTVKFIYGEDIATKFTRDISRAIIAVKDEEDGNIYILNSCEIEGEGEY